MLVYSSTLTPLTEPNGAYFRLKAHHHDDCSSFKSCGLEWLSSPADHRPTLHTAPWRRVGPGTANGTDQLGRQVFFYRSFNLRLKTYLITSVDQRIQPST